MICPSCGSVCGTFDSQCHACGASLAGVKRGELSKRDQKAWKEETGGGNGNVVGRIGGALIGGLIGGVAGVADREYEDWRMRQNVEKAIRSSKR
jgi:hypothetical protein